MKGKGRFLRGWDTIYKAYILDSIAYMETKRHSVQLEARMYREHGNMKIEDRKLDISCWT